MINKVILVGNVGADPEIRTLDNGIKCARIRLATTERIYNKERNETKEVTEWHSITLWRGLADVVDKYIRKGSQLYIEGKLRAREYEKNGVKCYGVDIVAEELKMLGRKEGVSQTALQTTPTPQPTQRTTPPAIDPLPFDYEMPF